MKKIPEHLAISKVCKITAVWWIISMLLLWLGIFVAIFSKLPGLIIIICGLLALIGNIIFSVKYYRCPYCNHFRPGTKHYCTCCGKELD